MDLFLSSSGKNSPQRKIKCACTYRQGFYFWLQLCDFQSLAIFFHFLKQMLSNLNYKRKSLLN